MLPSPNQNFQKLVWERKIIKIEINRITKEDDGLHD
jgi:hypothetical protein